MPSLKLGGAVCLSIAKLICIFPFLPQFKEFKEFFIFIAKVEIFLLKKIIKMMLK
jgi:hypothetical protein